MATKSSATVEDQDNAQAKPTRRRRTRSSTKTTGDKPEPGTTTPSSGSTTPPSTPANSGMSQSGQQSQGSSRSAKRRKKKRKKTSSSGASGPSGGIPAHLLPNEEELEKQAAELAEHLDTKEGKDAVKNALVLEDLQKMNLKELHDLGDSLGLEDYHQTARPELIFRIVKAHAENQGLTIANGTLQIVKEGYGFLRSPEYSYLPGPDDIYISPSMIRSGALRPGMIVHGMVRAPKEGEQFLTMLRIDTVNGRDPQEVHNLSTFEDLTPLHPEERLVLETEPEKLETRIIDLVSPIGKGQRGLIVAPPRTGKTVLLQMMTRAIAQNHPEVRIMVLLIDERPEEVTDFKRNTPDEVEVIASTFDEESARHVQVTEMVIEKARRAVEFGDDVVILLDSITRLARAYNNEMPHSGKIMTGGIDSGALQRPKKFFGSARAIEDGGSLTILATALVDTGSKADEVIFEEFKGTGNSELHLDRRLVDKRVWPAIDISASGTRREELLMDPKELDLVYRLRKVLADMNVVEAMELVKGRLAKAPTNAEFLMTMNMG
ncbi:MAG: transcription termination factor Rho [Phycisphaerales bacterium JB043]